jgi:hypothetical protein
MDSHGFVDSLLFRGVQQKLFHVAQHCILWRGIACYLYAKTSRQLLWYVFVCWREKNVVRFKSYQILFLVDAMHGSKWTFKTRIHTCLIVQIVALCVAPFAGYYGLIVVSMIIGCATWIAHSCTTSLSGMVKFNSSIMQQIGFALPAVFGIVTSLIFGLSDDDVPDLKIKLFFFSIAIFVVPGNISWVS